ncbi:MAG: ABC transporter ATP-binding protein, partial [Humidesulfovibrio sp.]|nr:ABC transporter ATP-binding protein [Humidesulfovibrio sp.]
LVSHDRAFLNNVVTSTLVFEGNGVVAEYVGGYDDWLRQRPEQAPQPASKPALVKQPEAPASPGLTSGRPRKLSFKEQREKEALAEELAAFPARIEALEKDIAKATERLADPELYKKAPKVLTMTRNELVGMQAELEETFARWEKAEARLGELNTAP